MNGIFDNTFERSNDSSKKPITKVLATFSNDRIPNAMPINKVITYDDLIIAHKVLYVLMYDLGGFSEINTIGFIPQNDDYINLSKKLSPYDTQEILDIIKAATILENAFIKNLNDIFYEGTFSTETGEYSIVDYAKKGKLIRPQECSEFMLEEAAYVVKKILKLRKSRAYLSKLLRSFRAGSGTVGFCQHKNPATKISKLSLIRITSGLYELYSSEKVIVDKIISNN